MRETERERENIFGCNGNVFAEQNQNCIAFFYNNCTVDRIRAAYMLAYFLLQIGILANMTVIHSCLIQIVFIIRTVALLSSWEHLYLQVTP